MSFPSNITVEHVNKALSEIEISKIPSERRSVHYFLNHKNKEFPPKYVISIANKYANGTVLTGKGFHPVEANEFLKKLGFNITERKENSSKLPINWREGKFKNGINLKQEFKNYLNRNVKPNSHKASSYIQALELLPEILLRKANDKMKGLEKIWEIDSLQHIEDLYQYILVQQKEGQNGIFNNESRSSYWIRQFYSASLKSYKEFLQNISLKEDNPKSSKEKIVKIAFTMDNFKKDIAVAELFFSDKILSRFSASLLTKPFLILSGLSGSGKTKLAQAFVYWICGDENQFKIVPVGADWTNREPLLGYPNALDQLQYIKPDNGVVDLIIHARDNQNLPHFLILDEMNLSHVERYFADFLSAMESGGKISFHSGEKDKNGVPSSITIPTNLFIVGTINVDETTYMFSPKVLDRANVIEFRISKLEMEVFLKNPLKPNMQELKGKGVEVAKSFLELARKLDFNNASVKSINEKLIEFFTELKKTGAEFGYRSAYEIHRLINQLSVIDHSLSEDEKLDIAIMQKLLPKLHGSRRKLCPILQTLGKFCVQPDKFKDIEKEIFLKEDFNYTEEGVKFPLSLEKLSRMFNSAVDNGFASYAEA